MERKDFQAYRAICYVLKRCHTLGISFDCLLNHPDLARFHLSAKKLTDLLFLAQYRGEIRGLPRDLSRLKPSTAIYSTDV